MRNKQRFFVLTAVFSMLTSCTPAYALDMDLSYEYKTESRDEFVIVGESHLNFNGEIPDYLRDIYDITPQMAYDSQYGSNIIEPNKPVLNHTTYAPRYAPSGGFTQSPSGLVFGNPMDGGSAAGNASIYKRSRFANCASVVQFVNFIFGPPWLCLFHSVSVYLTILWGGKQGFFLV